MTCAGGASGELELAAGEDEAEEEELLGIPDERSARRAAKGSDFEEPGKDGGRKSRGGNVDSGMVLEVSESWRVETRQGAV